MAAQHIYEFGAFRLDPSERQLFQDGKPVALAPKAFEILLALVENSGHLVTKDDLMKRVWPNAFVEEANLAQNISAIRRVLGDGNGTGQYIETVPKGGYRFKVEVRVDTRISRQVTSADEPPETVVGISPAKPLNRARQLALLIAIGVVLTALFVFAARRILRPLGQPSAATQIRRLAVLPFVNLSSDPEQEYFSDGMTDELITDLAKISDLLVISHTSVERYKNTHESLRQIAQNLGVDAIVEGRVLRSGSRVRISAQLIDTRTDQHVWAESYERDVRDVLRLQSEVAEAIAQEIRIHVTTEQRARLRTAPKVNPAAYENFLKGRFYQTSGFYSLSALENAREKFEQAIQDDPNFAPAYAGLAQSYAFLALFQRMRPRDGYRPAREAIQKALELDPSLGEAHAVLGLLSWRFEWDWVKAEREFHRAIELSPSYVDAHQYFALYLAWRDRRAEALAQVAAVRELSPGLPMADWTAAVYYHVRDYNALLIASRNWLAMKADTWLAHFCVGVAYEGLGHRSEAIPEYQKAVALSEGDVDARAALAYAYGRSGVPEAKDMLNQLLRESQDHYVPPYMIATVYAGLGQKEKAFEFLEKAYEEKSPDMLWELNSDLRVDTLRSDPRFRDLISRLRVPN